LLAAILVAVIVPLPIIQVH